MAIKKFRPTSPGRRLIDPELSRTDNSKNEPHKPLIRKLQETHRRP